MSTQPTLPRGIQRDDTEHGVTYYTADEVRQAVEADRAQRGVPAGWVLVPREPDETMESCGDMTLSCGAKDVYRAMLSAAPPAPVQQPQAQPSAQEPARHPMQPIVVDPQGVYRFLKNEIVDHLYEWARDRGMGLNELHAMEFSDKDRRQFAQLIGYSVSGYGGLSYVDDESCAKADALVSERLDRAANTKGASHE